MRRRAISLVIVSVIVAIILAIVINQNRPTIDQSFGQPSMANYLLVILIIAEVSVAFLSMPLKEETRNITSKNRKSQNIIIN